jgi:hypothetical protein
MSFEFAPAKREQVSLLIALAGASGSGKTFSALRLARGMSPDGKIAFIDTEARRGLHYAEQFQFLHSDMRPPCVCVCVCVRRPGPTTVSPLPIAAAG